MYVTLKLRTVSKSLDPQPRQSQRPDRVPLLGLLLSTEQVCSRKLMRCAPRNADLIRPLREQSVQSRVRTAGHTQAWALLRVHILGAERPLRVPGSFPTPAEPSAYSPEILHRPHDTPPRLLPSLWELLMSRRDTFSRLQRTTALGPASQEMCAWAEGSLPRAPLLLPGCPAGSGVKGRPFLPHM